MKAEVIRVLPLVKSERLLLRPLERGDAALIAAATSDRRLAEGTRAIPHPLPVGEAEAFVARARSNDAEEDVWAMDGSASGLPALVGLVSLMRITFDQSEVGYWVAAEYWNTGLASEALNALVSADPHDARTLFAEVFQDNPPQARVLTNAGFQYLGDAEAYSAARGKRVPTWTYIKKLK